MEFNNNKTEKQTSLEQQFNEFNESIQNYLSEEGEYGKYLCEGAIDLSLIASTDYENPIHDELPFDMARKFIEMYGMHVKNELRPVGDELVSIDMTKCCSLSILRVDEKDGFLHDALKLIRMGYNIKLNYRREEHLTKEDIDDDKTEEISKFNQISGWDLGYIEYDMLRGYYLLMGCDLLQDAIKDISSGVLFMKDGSIYYGFEGDEFFKVHVHDSVHERMLDDDLEIEVDSNEEVDKFNKILGWGITNNQYEALKNEYSHMNLGFPQDALRDVSSGILSMRDDGEIHYGFENDEFFDIDSAGSVCSF